MAIAAGGAAIGIGIAILKTTSSPAALCRKGAPAP